MVSHRRQNADLRTSQPAAGGKTCLTESLCTEYEENHPFVTEGKGA